MKKKNTFMEGIIWNYGSLIILSISGFLFNCLIMSFYDAAVLGIFNQAYAWYIVLSQISVMGVHMSVGKRTAEFCGEWDKVKTLVLSALVETFLIAGILTAIFECALPIMIAENKNLLCGMQVVIPGLLFFSLNKILLSYLNGISEMKVYAIFQSLRYILIAILILIMALMHVEGKYLSAALSMAEVILLVCMCLYLWRKKMLGGRVDRSWMHEHFRFGIRILPANMVLELNTRVDILCLGLVMRNDYLIGIYSFAALFAEGFYQIYIVIRRSINPQITAAHVNKGLCNFIKEFINSSIGKYFRVLSFSALILLAAGYLGICMLIGRHEYLGGIKLLIIIALAIAFNGKQIIFGNIFSQTGIPMYESYINVLTVTSNIILNVILIMWWGAYGAAIATSISYCVYGYAIKHLAKKKLDVKL